jgi:hypothetical protein
LERKDLNPSNYQDKAKRTHNTSSTSSKEKKDFGDEIPTLLGIQLSLYYLKAKA